MVRIENFKDIPVCEKEILRYAGCKSLDEELLQLLHLCLEEVLPKLTYKVCHIELPLYIEEDLCDFGCIQVKSKHLAKNLSDCESVILFAATIGVEIDRLIAKYGRISPTKALLMQAIGAERIEGLCDAFENQMREISTLEGKEFCPRFSPGYGDLPLEMQKDIFRVLDCSKHIGLSLNESLLMSPSKSVTAFIGVKKTSDADHENGFVKNEIKKCACCAKTDCTFREI